MSEISCDFQGLGVVDILKLLVESDGAGGFQLKNDCCLEDMLNAIESTTEALKTIDYPHAEIHGGSGYSLSYPITIPAANEVEVRIATPDTTRWAHMVWAFTNDSDFTVDVYEDTTKTDVVGNRLTPMNANRNSSNTSGLTICHTPGGAGDGNVIWSFAGGANKQVTTFDGRHEFILKQNTAYLVNLSGAQNDVAHLIFDWYEHTNH